MSGHSKWSQIKRKKETADAKRGQAFTHLSAQIKQAARSGRDPAANPALAEAIARAKRANMPQNNIDRLLAQTNLASSQPVLYEAFGPGGTALLITAVTDNNRRTVAQLRVLLKEYDARLGQPGSVAWKFTSRTPRQYIAKYPQPINPENKTRLSSLLKKLSSHPDIKQVFSDAVE